MNLFRQLRPVHQLQIPLARDLRTQEQIDHQWELEYQSRVRRNPKARDVDRRLRQAGFV